MRKLTILYRAMACFLLLGELLAWRPEIWAQNPQIMEAPNADEMTEAPEKVDVQPIAQDTQIDERLTGILEATEWFLTPEVEVHDGVVFLDGRTHTEARRQWAGHLARNTQDVVAVVNRIEIIPRPAWDFSPARAEIRALWRGVIQAIPLLFFGIVILVLSWWAAKLVARVSQHLLRGRLSSPLLAAIAARTLAIPVFLLGVYLVLQVAGLTRLAMTLLGGTGIAGIVIGFAFRDIAENFLASLLLSMRRPFRSNDLIEVAGNTGIVQQMNTRNTILMTLEGNHVQIPNAIVFKNTIINYTANPNRRADFVVGIGYDDSIVQAQELIAHILHDHPAVRQTPEPMVLVEELGAATVNLRVYFWYDATQYAPDKIKSSLVRLTKRVLQDAAISMPDEAREVIFPKGVPIVQMQQLEELPPQEPQAGMEGLAERPSTPIPSPEPLTTAAEGDLRSEEQEIQKQAKQSRTPGEGENLLEET